MIAQRVVYLWLFDNELSKPSQLFMFVVLSLWRRRRRQ